ncbi:MAG TPA: hypothetical protein VFJ64_12520 [Solirubrobacterales bacterium]|nr:hypothetical protein [Solirubrobacterales bacterium]
MSSTGVDKTDKPAMNDTALPSRDVYGAIAAVNFADLVLKWPSRQTSQRSSR